MAGTKEFGFYLLSNTLAFDRLVVWSDKRCTRDTNKPTCVL